MIISWNKLKTSGRVFAKSIPDGPHRRRILSNYRPKSQAKRLLCSSASSPSLSSRDYCSSRSKEHPPDRLLQRIRCFLVLLLLMVYCNPLKASSTRMCRGNGQLMGKCIIPLKSMDSESCQRIHFPFLAPFLIKPRFKSCANYYPTSH